MQVYLVRHGQTGGNVAHRHQAEHSPLSDEGRLQVERVAIEIKNLAPDYLVTSSLVRAVETARVIGQACDLVPEVSQEFIELVRPSHIYGHFHASPRSILFYLQWFFGRKSDGESYKEIRQRFGKAENFLIKYPVEAKVVVVSHAVFINLFLAHACDRRAMSILRAAKVFIKILSIPNTKVITLHFDPNAPKNVCAWRVIT
jgi:broad specificity phosphatase PhoE